MPDDPEFVPFTMVDVPTRAAFEAKIAAVNERINALAEVIGQRDAKIAALEERLAGITMPAPPDLSEITRKLSGQGGRIQDLENWRKTVATAAPKSGARKA